MFWDRVKHTSHQMSGKGSGCGGSLERLPNGIIINEILLNLDLESLCSVACVSQTLRSSASQALSSLSSLHLSAFSPDVQTLNHIISKFKELKSVTLDCLRLDDSSVINILGAHIQELSLLKCSSLSNKVLISIGEKCPNLRALVLELASGDEMSQNLIKMLKGCFSLESLCIKLRGTEHDAIRSVELFLPETVKVLKFQPMLEGDAIRLVHKLGSHKNFFETSSNSSIPFCPCSPGFALQRLSLVLDVISDGLVTSIVNSLRLLVELDLEDRPINEPLVPHDLTNTGLQFLGFCQHLIGLSVVRSRQNYPASFKRINDMGMFLLSENCTDLQSVRFGGFSKVSDAGFSAILHSCKKLKKFEVRNALLLSDLTFHDITRTLRSLVEFRLLSCDLLTSEALEELPCSSTLEVLDLCGCRSVADRSLDYISCLSTLTTLNLKGSDITDSGMAVLGSGHSPIACLCVSGCKRVTDKGIAYLLNGGGTISRTLSSLDLGSMPGISDKAILTIAAFAEALVELCIRYCFYVTDASLKALASKEGSRGGRKVLRRLDLYHCIGLSAESVELLKKPSFRGLQWLGVGFTRLACRIYDFDEIYKEQPWLTVCFDGCEVGCHDGWQFHKSGYTVHLDSFTIP